MNQDLLSQAAFEGLPVPAYMKDQQGVYRLANQALADFFGVEVGSIVGKTDADLGRACIEAITENDQAVLSSGQTTVYQEGLAYIKKSVFKDDQGQAIGTLGVVLPQRECEELFTERQTHYEKLFTALPGNVYVKDVQGRTLDCNDQQAAMFGYSSRAEMIGKTTGDFSRLDTKAGPVPGDITKVDEFDQEVLATARMKVGEERALGEDGKVHYYISHKVPLHGKNQEVIGLIGVSIDVTDQAEREYTLSQIVDSMPGNVYWKDRESILLGANLQQAKFFGYDKVEDIIGKRNEELLPPLMGSLEKKELAKKIAFIDQEVMNLDEPRTIEEVVTPQSAPKAYYLSYKVPLHNRQGEVTGLVGISVDITDKKMAELQLREALLQKSEILATLVNEFRSYFSAQEIMLNTVLDEGVSQTQRELIHNVIQANVSREQMLDYAAEFTKLDSGELDVKGIPLRLIPRLERLVEHLHWQQSGDIEVFLTFNMPLDEFLIFANPDYLFNVLALSASKIAEHTSSGYINIVVERVQVENKPFIRLQFEYTGQPIKDDIINKLLSNKAFESSLWGSAIHFAYSRKFLEAMGGQYYLANEPEKGTVLRLGFPDKGEQNYGEDYGLQGQLNVAIIDGNAVRRRSIQSSVWNAKVDDFVDVDDFNEKVASSTYDVIVLDEDSYNLQVRDQFAARQQELNLLILAKEPRRPQRYQKLRIFYLTKPTLPLALNRKLHGLLAQHRVLVVEDNSMLRQALKTHLEAEGFIVDVAKDGQQALEMANIRHEAIVMDIGLPDKSGVEVTQALQEKRQGKQPKYLAFTGLTHEYDEDELESIGLFDYIIVKGKPMSDVVKVLQDLLAEE